MTGDDVRALRLAWGLTPPELATVLGVAPNSIYRWERMAAPKIEDPFWLVVLGQLDWEKHAPGLKATLTLGRANAYLYLLNLLRSGGPTA